MNVTLLKSLIALLPTCVLFSDSVILFLRGKTAYILLLLVGAGCLVIVVLTHLFEALNLFLRMHWGWRIA